MDDILLQSYDQKWPLKAQKEIDRLRSLISSFSWVKAIEHIGSTAVPPLKAKPVIDILITVTDLNQAKEHLPLVFKKEEYIYWSDNPKKYHLFFVKGMPPFGKVRTHHIHVYLDNSFDAFSRPLFRDYLNSHPEIAQKYESLKETLAQKFPHDREGYTRGKDAFVNEVHLKIFKEIIHFKPLRLDHLPQLFTWLNLTPQLKWFGEDQQISFEAVKEKYVPYCEGYKIEKGIKKSINGFIFFINHQPMGYIQYYNAKDFDRDFGQVPDPLFQRYGKVAALDFFIGNTEYLRRGWAPIVLKQFLHQYIFLTCDACFVDPDTENASALKAYQQAGFEISDEIPPFNFTPLIARKNFLFTLDNKIYDH